MSILRRIVRRLDRWADRIIQPQLEEARTNPRYAPNRSSEWYAEWTITDTRPHQVMPGHDPEPTTSYRRTPVDPKSWDAHCATALWAARPEGGE